MRSIRPSAAPGDGPARLRAIIGKINHVRSMIENMPHAYTDLLKRLRAHATDARVCATAEMIAAAEADLGFRLPQLLRLTYRYVGNGGFGPGHGLLGLKGGDVKEHDDHLVDIYQQREPSAFERQERPAADLWPEQLLPFCTYGCAIYSCVDCSTRKDRVIHYDPNLDEKRHFTLESRSLANWFEAWLKGWTIEERMEEARTKRRG